MYTILVASLNNNVKLANKIKENLDKKSIENEIINLIELDLTMYSSKKEEQGIPLNVLELHSKMENSKAFIIVTPEYNYSMPPVLTNTIAWVSRVGEDFKKIFENKKVLLATHSGGGGKDVIYDSKKQFSKLNANVYEKEIITTYKKVLDEDYLEEVIDGFSKVLFKDTNISNV